MRKVSLILGALCAISICGSTFAATVGRIDQRSVWAGVNLSNCQTLADDAAKRSCLIDVMRTHGASPRAVAFTRAYKDLAYISKFTAYGPVDLAIATSPFMANSNDSFMLVNGRPAIVDVADQASEANLSTNAVYRAFMAAHANLHLWPLNGDFTGQHRLHGGAQRFVFSASFRQCHACATVAKAELAYDFDGAGNFLGMHLLNISDGTGRQPVADAARPFRALLVEGESASEGDVCLGSEAAVDFTSDSGPQGGLL